MARCVLFLFWVGMGMVLAGLVATVWAVVAWNPGVGFGAALLLVAGSLLATVCASATRACE